MKSLFFSFLIFALPLLSASLPVSAVEPTNLRIAMLVSGHGNMGDTNISYDLEELAQSYLIFKRNGMQIDIISPQGGAVPVHNKKDKLEYIQIFKQKTPALSQLANTISANKALNNDYDALFVVGGDGAMFDLPFDPETQAFITSFVHSDKAIAAVCHGPAALVNVTTKDGIPFVKNKRVNAFTLREEQAFSAKLMEHFPFMLETELKSKGALFVSNDPMLPYVASDGNLITAQNPMSVARAAEALVLKLGKTPVARTLFKDEATLSLISQARNQGAIIIDMALASNKASYDMNYLALYGFYAYRLAQGTTSKLRELNIMERIGQHFSHPQYKKALIIAYIEQGQASKAKAEYASLQKAFPEFKLEAELSAKLTH